MAIIFNLVLYIWRNVERGFLFLFYFFFERDTVILKLAFTIFEISLISLEV